MIYTHKYDAEYAFGPALPIVDIIVSSLGVARLGACRARKRNENAYGRISQTVRNKY